MSYQDFKSRVYGQVIGDGQCVALVVNNSRAYAEYLFPGVSWTTIFPPVPAAKQLLNDANPAYFEKILNDHNNPNQIPQQGDVMVFDATPQAGYSNTYNNPYGHTGICESASPTGYTLLQQNSPYSSAPVNATHYAWRYRPCLGWLRPILHIEAATPVPAVVAPPAPTTTILGKIGGTLPNEPATEVAPATTTESQPSTPAPVEAAPPPPSQDNQPAPPVKDTEATTTQAPQNAALTALQWVLGFLLAIIGVTK